MKKTTSYTKYLEEAIKDYNEAICLNPKFAKAYNNRGNAKYKLTQYEEALKDLNEAIRLNPNFPEAYLNRMFAKNKPEQSAIK